MTWSSMGSDEPGKAEMSRASVEVRGRRRTGREAENRGASLTFYLARPPSLFTTLLTVLPAYDYYKSEATA